MKKNGFTLMEVLVALAILGASSAVFCKFVEGFLQLRGAERRQAQAFLCAAQTMEFLVHNIPSCGAAGQFTSGEPASSETSSADPCSEASYSLSPVPGLAHLLVAEVTAPSIHPVKLRRLVLCDADLP